MSEQNMLNSEFNEVTDSQGKNICEGNENPLEVKSDALEDIRKKAIDKLEKEKAGAKDKGFAEPIIGYLIKRCEEDSGLAEDVLQEHKTWKKCFDYIFGKARKQASGNCAAVRDEVVYEWAEDYYHKDDKAEEAKREKEAEERKRKDAEVKKKAEQKAAEKRKKTEKKVEAASKKAEKKEVEKPHPKKKTGELDGQMDLFSMMGL